MNYLSIVNFKILAIATLCSAVLVTPLTSIAGQTIFATTTQIKQQEQETTINLSLEDLRQPHYLKITTSGSATRISGKVELNGKLLQTLTSSGTSINLSPLLKPGTNVVKISGQYTPVDANINTEFVGNNTQITQQAGGSGYLSQKLIFVVSY
jgi:hypothetical protein